MRSLMAGLAVALLLNGASLAQPASPDAVGPAAHEVSFARMAARVPEGTAWAKLQLAYPLIGCRDLETLNWSAKNNQDIANPEYDRLFRTGLSQAGFKVAGDPDNLFQDDDKSADLQVGALVTDVSANFCGEQTLTERSHQSRHFEIKGSATMGLEWQVYSTAQARVIARIPTTGSYSSETAIDGGDQAILHGAFAANVRALAGSAAFRQAVSAPADAPAPRAGQAVSPIVYLAATPQAARAISQARLSVVTLFAGASMGSAFLISRDGYLLTNQHVVGEASEVRLRWPDGGESVGRVVRSDRRRDVAVIKADPGGRRPLVLRAAPAEPGEAVFAIGTPLEKNFQNTVTKGVVSAARTYQGLAFVQSDVAVDHGNSGGPLLDEHGQVIAMTDWGYAPDGVSHNLNFFIPIGEALKALALEPAAD
jgi:hypothetical protein